MITHYILFLFSFFVRGVVLGEQNSLQLVSFTQNLNHFATRENENVVQFQQRVYIDYTYTHYGNKSGPIFAFFGGEKRIDPYARSIGLLNKLSRQYNAIVIYMEHRFYGHSVPYGDIKMSMANDQVMACLTIDQALEDFKVIILSLKSNLSAYHSPVVAVGVGYSGALAAYFRLKYPNVVIGALASSAPMMLFGNYQISNPKDNYCSTVSWDFEVLGSTCYHAIESSWGQLDAIASQPSGLAYLTKLFKKCRAIQNVDEIKQELARLYSFAAIYYDPVYKGWLRHICNIIEEDKGNMAGFAEALFATIGFKQTCFSHDYGSGLINLHSPFDVVNSNKTIAWDWQRCNELIFPVSCDNATMLPAKAFNRIQFTDNCLSRFGVSPRPHFLERNFGHKDIKQILKIKGSNIIFSSGLKDPLAGEGILQNLSESVVAIMTNEGTYGMDLGNEIVGEPTWLAKQKEQESVIIDQWIRQNTFSNKGMKKTNCIPLFYSVLRSLVVVYLYLI